MKGGWVRAYPFFLRAYPRRFRERAAVELIAAFEVRLEQAHRRGGPQALRGRAMQELWDLVVNLGPAWWESRGEGRKEHERLATDTGGGVMSGFGGELGQTVRELVRRPGYAGTVILTVALGVGANAGVFSLVNGVLLEPLPYPEADRLVYMYETFRQDQTMSVSYPNYRDWREMNETFAEMGARTGWSFILTGRGDPRLLPTQLISANLPSILGVEPALGRMFTAEEEAREEQVVVVSHGLWTSVLGSDPAVVGSTLTLDGAPWTVVGVMPPGLEFPLEGRDFFAPLTTLSAESREIRSNHPGITVVGRLRDGVTLDRARRDMERVTGILAGRHPDSNTEHGARLLTLKERVVGDAGGVLLVIQGAVGLVFLIACANVANLILVRSVKTARDAGIRAALGAGRARILRKALVESLVLALTGGMLGVGLAYGSVEAVRAVGATSLPRLSRVEVDGTVLLFCLGASLVAGILAGVVPAVRVSGVDPGEILRGGGSRGGSRPTSRLRRVLVVGEVALTFVLLAGAGLMLRSTLNLLAADPGLEAEGVLTVRIPAPQDRYPSTDDRVRFYRTVLERVRALPGVISAGGVTPVPMGPSNWQSAISSEGQENVDDQGLRTEMARVTPGYFETLRIPLLKGRAFSDREPKGDPVAIVDETLAERLWPGRDPLNRTLTLRYGDGTWYRIVGVVGHVKNFGVSRESRVQMYLPYTQEVYSLSVVARTSGRPEALLPGIRRAVSEVDPNVPLTQVRPMAELERETMSSEILTARILGLFAAVSLLLALVGLYGVVAYTVSLRTREIGIRIALGARVRNVLGLVVGNGFGLVAGGLVLGVLGAAALTRSLSGLLYGVNALDLLTLVSVGALLGAVGLAATVVPARRAASIQPITALREE